MGPQPLAGGARRFEKSGCVMARRSHADACAFKMDGRRVAGHRSGPGSGGGWGGGDGFDEGFFDGFPAHGEGFHEEGLGDGDADDADAAIGVIFQEPTDERGATVEGNGGGIDLAVREHGDDLGGEGTGEGGAAVFEGNFPIGDGGGVDDEVKDVVVALEVLGEAIFDGEAEFKLVAINKFLAGGFREF